MNIRASYVTAACIALFIVAWLASGQIGGGNGPKAEPTAIVQAAAEPQPPSELPTVRVRTMTAEERQSELIVRGRTEALRKVEVKAETGGIVAATRVERGAQVKEGDVICELEVDARDAQLKRAQALLRQREIELKASETLVEKGHRSATQAAAARAAYDAARAEARALEIELAQTKIRAPFDGVVDDRMVSAGDFMRAGDACAMVVDLEPFLIVGEVSERDVGKVQIGAQARARMLSGAEVEGVVRFVATASSAATRTFRVEVETPNADHSLRDGVTAEVRLPVSKVLAHRISPAVLALDDAGAVGVRTVESGAVRFLPVQVVSDGPDGTWVAGLPATVTVITVGQEYVRDGQKVNAVEETGAATPQETAQR